MNLLYAQQNSPGKIQQIGYIYSSFVFFKNASCQVRLAYTPLYVSEEIVLRDGINEHTKSINGEIIVRPYI